MKTPEEIAEMIRALTAPELIELNRILGNDGGWDPIGVREPRTPSPDSPGDTVAQELPEDYWESAQ